MNNDHTAGTYTPEGSEKPLPPPPRGGSGEAAGPRDQRRLQVAEAIIQGQQRTIDMLCRVLRHHRITHINLDAMREEIND